MNYRIYKAAFPILLILIFIFLFGIYGKVLLSPNSYLFTSSGDGVKNYYAWAMHLKNDSSILEFQGMNYPYGQHFIYADCHPALYFIVKPISLIFPGILNYSIGILNLFMLLSFVLTPVFLWLVFRELKVHPYLAVIGAMGISLLAPQVFRLTGHLSLSYSFFIPLTLWLLLKAQADPKNISKWDFFLFVNGLFWFFIHPYLGMMETAFLFVFWFLKFVVHLKREVGKGRNYLRLIITIVLPVLLFLIFVKLTDHRTGRSTSPNGFFLYNAEPDDVLVPLYPPLRPLIDQIVEVRQQWEAWSYIGVLSIGILIFVLVRCFRNLIKQRKFTFDQKYLNNGNFRWILWSSVFLLFFSFGLPFKWSPDALDYFPLIKQFRATGRFTWFFFFSINIMAVMVLSKIWEYKKQKGRKKWILIMLLIPLFFPIVEGMPYHLDFSRQISQQANVFRTDKKATKGISEIKSIDPQMFQAIIPLPFYYNGSENFSIPPRGNIMLASTLVSYHTGLPIMGGALSRTGIEESRRIIQVISPDFYPKKIEQDLPSDQPFLIVRADAGLSVYEKALLNKCALIDEADGYTLLKLSKKDLFNSSAESEIKKFEQKKDSLSFDASGFYSSDSGSFVYFNAFDNLPSAQRFSDPGAFSGWKKEHLSIVDFPANTFKSNTSYALSVWFYNGGQDAVNNWFRLMKEEYDPGTDRWTESWVLPENSEVIFGDWSLVELDFEVLKSGNEVSFKTLGKVLDKQHFYLDDLLIREKNVDVYKILQEENGKIISLFKNNQRIQVQE